MNISSPYFATRAFFVVSYLAAAGACLAAPAGQGAGGQQNGMQAVPTDLQQTELHSLTDVQRQPGVKIDAREQSAYDAFYRVKPELVEKKIQLGNTFLAKYPSSVFAEAVDAGLVNAYYAKQDWKNFYATADRALALRPDDVDVLTTVGWVIPHFYDARADDADDQWTRAETFEKHAIEVLGKMSKPADLTEEQFTAAKAQKEIQAHSALGLVYFRRSDYANSAAELQRSLENNKNPDQTDLFVLGIDFQNLNQFSDAAAAFDRCAQQVGGLQDRCKQSVEAVKKQVAQPKP